MSVDSIARHAIDVRMLKQRINTVIQMMHTQGYLCEMEMINIAQTDPLGLSLSDLSEKDRLEIHSAIQEYATEMHKLSLKCQAISVIANDYLTEKISTASVGSLDDSGLVDKKLSLEALRTSEDMCSRAGSYSLLQYYVDRLATRSTIDCPSQANEMIFPSDCGNATVDRIPIFPKKIWRQRYIRKNQQILDVSEDVTDRSSLQNVINEEIAVADTVPVEDFGSFSDNKQETPVKDRKFSIPVDSSAEELEKNNDMIEESRSKTRTCANHDDVESTGDALRNPVANKSEDASPEIAAVIDKADALQIVDLSVGNQQNEDESSLHVRPKLEANTVMMRLMNRLQQMNKEDEECSNNVNKAANADIPDEEPEVQIISTVPGKMESMSTQNLAPPAVESLPEREATLSSSNVCPSTVSELHSDMAEPAVADIPLPPVPHPGVGNMLQILSDDDEPSVPRAPRSPAAVGFATPSVSRPRSLIPQYHSHFPSTCAGTPFVGPVPSYHSGYTWYNPGMYPNVYHPHHPGTMNNYYYGGGGPNLYDQHQYTPHIERNHQYRDNGDPRHSHRRRNDRSVDSDERRRPERRKRTKFD